MNEFFQILAATIAGILLAVATITMVFYLRMPMKEKAKQFHILAISISYTLLIICTMITVYYNFYGHNHIWRYLIITAYVLGAIALFPMLRFVAKKYYAKKRQDFLNK